jgi:hypothetical protein
MDTIAIVKKPEPFSISDEEREHLEQRRAAAADNAPVKVANLTAAKLNGLSRADLQKLLDSITSGNIE